LHIKIDFEWWIDFKQKGGPIVDYIFFVSKLQNPTTIFLLVAGSPFGFGSLLEIGSVFIDYIKGNEWASSSRIDGLY
jgi:hypothetical protein